MSGVMAIGTRTNNAELMQDCAALGYLDGHVIDMTYGLGRFWTTFHPVKLTCIDLDPKRGVTVADFRHLDYNDGEFSTAVFDPPYKLNGTSTGKGPSVSDADYGVSGAYQSIAEKHQVIIDGITEAARVARRFVLVKCQDQVCSGRVQWQTRIFADHGETCGLKLDDMMHVQGHREQPAGRSQLHARRDYSTLLIFRKAKR